MYRNNFYPLRKVVGSSVGISMILPITKAQQPFVIETRNHPDLSTTVSDPVYEHFLPDILANGTTFTPLPGMATLPVYESNPVSIAGLGMGSFLNVFRNPSDNPFSESEPLCGLFGYQDDQFLELKLGGPINGGNIPDNDFYSNRGSSCSFIILLSEEILVGGIAFTGYPFISSRIENVPEDMTAGNFGLPREISLTPLPSLKSGTINELTGIQRSQYIDAEFAYTRQEIISHSGFNYLCIDPVKTNLFLITITDLPFIPRLIDTDTNAGNIANPLLVKGFKGFAIPYLYFFQYKESTNRAARLHSGLLGIKTFARPLTEDGTPDLLRRAFPEFEFSMKKKKDSTKGEYILYTAHSSLGQRRLFEYSYANLNYPEAIKNINIRRDQKYLPECFVSDLLQKDEKIVLYLQQSEEYERCVAGLKALFLLLPPDQLSSRFAERLANRFGVGTPNNHLSLEERNFVEDLIAFMFSLPPEINFCEQIGIKIYEIDPIAGQSPVSVDLNSKYATLLTNTRVDDMVEVLLSQLMKGIPFRRISNCKYFAVEITNLGKPGQVAIWSMNLTRSAHVSVQPRPGRNQQVKTMHYRLIGQELADDFSGLGTDGFNFHIDKLVAGETKTVLYSAMSLLDLLHTGNAKIHSNVRRRAVEEEVYRVIGSKGDNYEKRRTRMDGWRSSETGHDVEGHEDWDDEYSLPGDFKQIANSEIRTHHSYLSPQEDHSYWKSNAFIGNALDHFYNMPSSRLGEVRELFRDPGNYSPFLGPEQEFVPTSKSVKLFSGFRPVWKGLVHRNGGDGVYDRDRLKIGGMKSVTSSPFGINRLSEELFEFLDALRRMDRTATVLLEGLDFASLLGTTLLTQGKVFALSAANSLSIGLNVQPFGLGISFSASTSGGLLLPSYTYVNSFGTQGTIQLQANRTGFSFFQSLNKSFDETTNFIDEGVNNRKILRRVSQEHLHDRVKGAEVLWQGLVQDIVTGSVPLNLTLPATARQQHFRTTDESLRVRFNSGFSPSVEVDFWFELTEETIKDDN